MALAHVTVPCESTHIIESKSFKLYLNGYNGTRFASADEVRERLLADVNAAIWHGGAMQAGVGVRLTLPEDFGAERMQELAGLCLDRLDIACDRYGPPAPELLTAAFDEQPVQETLTSHLLKSNCPVTRQPDWGSVQIAYSGPQIDQASLLRYLVSFREHNEVHEPCAADGAGPLHAPWRAGHQPMARQPPAGRSCQRAHGAAVGPVSKQGPNRRKREELRSLC